MAGPDLLFTPEQVATPPGERPVLRPNPQNLLGLPEEERLRLVKQKREGETDEAHFKRLYGGISQPKVPVWQGMLRDWLQGLYQGGGDEAEAIVSAAANEDDPGQRPGTTTLNPDGTVSYDPTPQSYVKNRLATIRGQREAFRKKHPGLSLTSEIGGAMTSGAFIPQATLAKSGTLMAQGANAAVNAAAQAFVYGFNAGEGGVGNRAKTGAQTAAIAAPVAGVLTPVASVVADKVAKWRAIGRAAKQQGLSRTAYQRLLRAAEADDAVQGQGARNVAAAGPDAMPADAGPTSAGIVDQAMQAPGPAQRIGNQNIQGRVSRAGTRLQGTLDDTMGAPQGPRAVTKGIAQSTSAQREAAYTKAYGNAIDYASDAGRNIENVLAKVPGKIGLEAVDEANEMMLMEGKRQARQIMAKVADDGSVQFVELPNTMQLDYLKRALGELAEDQVDKVTGQITGRGLRLRGLTRQLKRAISAANDDYAAAVKKGGDAIERKQAVWLGRSMLKPSTTREIVEEGLDGISDDARLEAVKGLRSYIDDQLANAKQTIASLARSGSDMDKSAATEAVKAVKDLSSRAAKEKMIMLLGPRAARRISREVERTAMALGLRGRTARNSATASRLIMHDENKALVQEGLKNKLLGGHPLEAAREGWQMMTGRTPAAQQKVLEDVNRELVEWLTRPGRWSATKKVSDLSKVQNQIIPGMRARGTAGARAVFGRSGAVTAPSAQRYLEE